MSIRRNDFIALVLSGALVAASMSHAADLPSDWRRTQTFNVSTTGLVKIIIPLETIDSATPGLKDLRLYDDLGTEVPYVVERPAPVAPMVREAKSFQVALDQLGTIITVETGVSDPIEAISLDGPANDFIKPVSVERSDDGATWRPIVRNIPLFREHGIASDISIPVVPARWLRLTLDDRRSQAVPVAGVRLHLVGGASPPVEWANATIASRDENPGESRLTLNLGAANLDVAEVRLSTAEPLFKRSVRFAVPLMSGDSIREQTVGQGTILRINVDGQERAENLMLPLTSQVPGREIYLFIQNGDSPPLPVSLVEIGCHVPALVFLARQAGVFHLLTGNNHCEAPKYDLADLRMRLSDVPVLPVSISAPSENPNYRMRDALPGIDGAGALLDVSRWSYRVPLKVSVAGAQQLELPPEILARAQPDFSDVRILRASNQVPYIIQHTSISRSLTPEILLTNDVKQPGLSRWRIRLPQAGLPLSSLSCVSSTPLFDRAMELYEIQRDESGNTIRNLVGRATWQRTPDRNTANFSLSLTDSLRPLHSDTLYLETENGDNPPITLDHFQVYYPVTRILFKTEPAGELYIYFGNEKAAAPRYDLSLVTQELLAADKASASLSIVQQLKTAGELPPSNDRAGVVFWAVLAAVVAGLLAIISRLLPKPQTASK